VSLRRECKLVVFSDLILADNNCSSTEASWHADYRDTAYIYIGGLPFELSEGDIITIFSQFGEPTYINLIREKETGKSRGFAFLKYEDQRSTDLAVDNLGGAIIMNSTLKVDHTRYKKRDDQPDEGVDLTEEPKQIEDDEGEGRRKRRRTSESEDERPMLKEEQELAKLIQYHDEEDPMKAFLVQEKREEVALALAKLRDGKKPEKSRKHRHHHRVRRERDGEDEGEEENVEESRTSTHRNDGRGRKRPALPGASSPVKGGSSSRRRGRDGDDRARAEEYESRRRSPRRDSRERDAERQRRRREDSRDDYSHRRSRKDP
jgi:RNA-binding motif protein, X-linked 2